MAAQAGLSLTWPQTPKTGFLVTGLQSSLTKDPKPILFPGLPGQQQLFLYWRSYGGTRTSHLPWKLSWCRCSTYLHSVMPVSAGLWQWAELERRIQALEMLPETSEHFLQRPYVEWGGSQQYPWCNKSAWLSSKYDEESKWKLIRCGHISRSSSRVKIMLQGTVKGAWQRDIKRWTGMGFGGSLRAAEDRERWRGIVAASSVVSQQLSRLRDWDEISRF